MRMHFKNHSQRMPGAEGTLLKMMLFHRKPGGLADLPLDVQRTPYPLEIVVHQTIATPTIRVEKVMAIIRIKKATFKEKVAHSLRKLRQKLKTLPSVILDSPIKTAFILLVTLGLSVVLLDFKTGLYSSKDFFPGVLIEAHGMLFDIIFIVIVLQWFEKVREKRLQISRWEEEIDDLRLVRTEHSKARVVGLIKRLQKAGITELDLHACDLSGSELMYMDFTNSDFMQADLSDSCLNSTDFSGATFSEANLAGAGLDGACLENATFDMAVLERARAMYARGLNAQQLAAARTLSLADLPIEIIPELKKSHPHLFKPCEPAK